MSKTSLFGKGLTNYQMTNLRLKEFADDNFKFEENGRKLFKPAENTVGKGEIAHYEQFLFFPHCFQKACFPGVSKGVIVWEWVKVFMQNFLTLIPGHYLQAGMLHHNSRNARGTEFLPSFHSTMQI